MKLNLDIHYLYTTHASVKESHLYMNLEYLVLENCVGISIFDSLNYLHGTSATKNGVNKVSIEFLKNKCYTNLNHFLSDIFNINPYEFCYRIDSKDFEVVEREVLGFINLITQ